MLSSGVEWNTDFELAKNIWVKLPLKSFWDLSNNLEIMKLLWVQGKLNLHFNKFNLVGSASLIPSTLVPERKIWNSIIHGEELLSSYCETLISNQLANTIIKLLRKFSLRIEIEKLQAARWICNDAKVAIGIFLNLFEIQVWLGQHDSCIAIHDVKQFLRKMWWKV